MSEESNTDTGDTKVSNEEETLAVSDQDAIDNSVPREALIATAMNFLQNSKIRNSSILKKKQFLLSKGLSSKEIQIACKRLGIFYPDSNNSTIINMDINAPQLPPAPPHMLSISRRTKRQPNKISPFERFNEILQSVTLFSGLAYAIYYLYKNYIEPFLFGKKKKKTIDESLQDIDIKVETKLNDVNRELSNIKETLNVNSQQQNQLMNIEFNNFKNDLEAIKGLLLNRKQFANPLTTVPPSIPAWQLSSAPHRRNSHSDNEKNDDAGSGSSETEVVTKNSDSSLEIM